MQRFIRQQRILYLALLCIAIMLLYVIRLGYIQLFRHNKLTMEAVRQRAQAITLDYNRGNILDRNGISLSRRYNGKAFGSISHASGKSGRIL